LTGAEPLSRNHTNLSRAPLDAQSNHSGARGRQSELCDSARRRLCAASPKTEPITQRETDARHYESRVAD